MYGEMRREVHMNWQTTLSPADLWRVHIKQFARYWPSGTYSKLLYYAFSFAVRPETGLKGAYHTYFEIHASKIYEVGSDRVMSKNIPCCRPIKEIFRK